MNNSSINPYAAQSYSQTLFVNIIRMVFGFLAMFGNTFLLFVMGKNPKIRASLCNQLIGLLAFADLCTGMGYFFGSSATLTFQLIEWYDYTIGHCLIIQYFMTFGAVMSQLATLVIAIDRFRAVQNPIKYYNRKKVDHIVYSTSLFAILYSIISSAFMFIGVDFNSRPIICQAGAVMNAYYQRYISIFTLVVTVLVFIFYIRTARALKKRLSNNVRNDSINHELTKQCAVFKTIKIVLLVYGVCWCVPNFIVYFIGYTMPSSRALSGKISPLIAIGTGLNSSANVLVYAWKHHELGKAMRKILFKTKAKGTAVQTVGSAEAGAARPAPCINKSL